MQGVDVLCENMKRLFLYMQHHQNFYHYVYIENPIKILICAWLFVLISSIIKITKDICTEKRDCMQLNNYLEYLEKNSNGLFR